MQEKMFLRTSAN